MYFSNESLIGYISGGELTEKEKLLIQLEDEFNYLKALRFSH